MAARERTDDVERTERERAQWDLAAAGDRRIDPAVAQVAQRLADGDRPRGARIGGREDRPADAERDPEVRRRGTTEHGQGEVRRDLADAALEVALMLLLGVGDATERRAEVDPGPLGRRCSPAPGTKPASSSASRPTTSPNWLNRSSERAVLGGIHASGSKSSTWAATCDRNVLGSNRSIRRTGERAARRPARNASRPMPVAVMMPMPVIQTRRRSVISIRTPFRRARTPGTHVEVRGATGSRRAPSGPLRSPRPVP